ncbi:glycerol-3-phosphate dehydrogenase/oxidase [Oceanobacillus sp. CAU 1775]
MGSLSSFERKTTLEKMTTDFYDLIIIGGGITGAGIALDAVTRGMKVALVEMQDFAGGTSSRSTKLVHGGLRYLQQFEVKMVAEVGKEREIVYENGPHVTTPEWMLLPFHKGSNLGPLTSSVGLRAYDFLAGVRKTERRKMLNVEETLEKEPLLKRNGIKGSGYYVEYKTDDGRLTLEVIKKAIQHGADAINYLKADSFLYNSENKVTGLLTVDQITGSKHEIRGKKIINATGPWVDFIRDIDKSKTGKTLLLTKGTHLVFDQSVFPLQQAVYFDTPDKRMIFAIPREGKAYVGTTDTVYDGEMENPKVTNEDRDYILEAIHYMFPDVNITANDVESSWAGLRPLIAQQGKDNPSEISRKDEIFISPSGLISIAGGKLTGYRKMAEDIVNRVAKQFKAEDGILYSESMTKHLPISGGEVNGSKGFIKFKEEKLSEALELGINEILAKQMIQRYGANVDKLFQLYQKKQADKTDELDTLLLAELQYAMEYEAAYKPTDFFIRRTGALFFNINFIKENKQAVIDYMNKQLGWTEQQKNSYTTELDQQLTLATSFPSK